MTTKAEALAAIDAAKASIESLDLTGVAPPPPVGVTYMITGTVYRDVLDDGPIVQGVTIDAPGATPPTQVTGANGTYSITVPSGWNGRVTATHAGDNLSTPHDYTNVQGGKNLQGFVATAAAAGNPSAPPNSGANVALAANGGVATASSVVNANFPASAANNGDRKGVSWGNGGGWNSAQNPSPASPDWLQIHFDGPKTIKQANVFTVQDNYANPIEPTDALTFSSEGIVDFTIEVWDGLNWVKVAAVVNNSKVKCGVTFPPVTTDRARCVITKAKDGFSRIVEFELLT